MGWTRSAIGLAVAASTTSLIATLASAGESVKNPDEGLVFYSTNPTFVVGRQVGRQAAPDGLCHPLSPDAQWYLIWSGGFQTITLYEGSDCTGNAIAYPPSRSFQPGSWASYAGFAANDQSDACRERQGPSGWP
ncbi:hypothetical protein ACWDV4_00125 [Micromonospora sp. NPDC003197]